MHDYATERRAILTACGLSPDLLAVDPAGCGCTECLIGEYIPANEIPTDQEHVFQNLIRQGVLNDHTDGWFMTRAEPEAEETFTREDMARAWSEGYGADSYGHYPPKNPYEEA